MEMSAKGVSTTAATTPAAASAPSRGKLASLYYFADRTDYALVFTGCLFKLAFGATQGFVIVIFGDFFDVSPDKFEEAGLFFMQMMAILGAVSALFEGVGTSCIEWSKNRQVAKWKKGYIKGILRQDVGWYDVNKPQELSTRMGESLVHIESGLGIGTAGLFCAGLGQFVLSTGIGIFYKWDLALVALGVAAFTYIPAMFYLFGALDKRTKSLADAYAGAGGVASEILSGLRTVASLGLEPNALVRYEAQLLSTQTTVTASTRRIGFAVAAMNSGMYYILGVASLYATYLFYWEYTDSTFDYSFDGQPYCAHTCGEYTIWQGDTNSIGTDCSGSVDGYPTGKLTPFKMTCASGRQITRDDFYLRAFTSGYDNMSEVGSTRASAFGDEFEEADKTGPGCTISIAIMYVAIQALFQGVFSCAQLSSPVQNFLKAATACNQVLQTIARTPPIDSFSEAGASPASVRGEIVLSDVTFAYPSAPHVNVCQGYNLTIPAGSSCAMCGPSGSGKSTIIALLERFYDPISGSVTLDGADLKTLNLKWLRKQLGLVSQEPTLFVGTVAENIQMGLPGASQADIEEAAKLANAHDFILKRLNEGYNTQVGLGGGKLSGGQKQRIAIARAIIKKPSIMLLDEATSALDNASEKVVQAALDDIMKQGAFTSVTIAHRLSTIMRSDKIALVKKGRIVEQGTYDELLAIGEDGEFYQLAAKQQAHREEDSEAMNATQSNEDGDVDNPKSGSKDKGDKSRDKSVAKDASFTKDAKGEEEETKKKEVDPMRRLLSHITPGDGKYYVLGVVCGGLTGIGKGLFGLLMMRTMTALSPADPNEIRSEGLFWSISFICLGCITMVLEMTALNALSIVGERLTKNVRLALMEKLLHLEVGYFDHEDNSMGALTEFLGQKVTLMQGLVGERLGMLAQSIVMLVSTIFTMFYWGDWRVALVVLGCLPITGVLMSVAMASMMPMDQGKQGKQEKDGAQNKSAGAIVGEVVLGIRTVASFNAETQFYADYSTQVEDIAAKGQPRAIKGGMLNGVAMGGIFIIFGVQLYYGLWLAANGHLFSLELERDSSGCIQYDPFLFMDKIMVPIMAIFMVMMMASGMAMMATDAKSASDAAKELFERFDYESKCDPFSEEGQQLGEVKGRVQLMNVTFAYPTATAFKTLSSFSLDVKAGQVCALCGPSGSGKSTIIALLQRFYDPTSGSVMLDGVELKSLNLKWLRRQMGMVGQEPVLFEGTVAQNISYGKEGATQAEIEEAAEAANAHQFITEDIGDGYNTQVGLRGGKLSGGQKQRIAIARAIIKKPSIMLLDEATSALDNASEKVVQAALDAMMSKMKHTTFTIAHRLSTIRGADTIAVVNGGKVVEQGTHDELLKNAKGLYFKLVQAQQ